MRHRCGGSQNQNDYVILEYVLLGDWNLVYSPTMSITNHFPSPIQSFATCITSSIYGENLIT